MTHHHEFFRDGRAYRIVSVNDSRIAPQGFERVPAEEASWLVAGWTDERDPLARVLWPSDPFGSISRPPNHAGPGWLAERLRERLTSAARDLVLFQRVEPQPPIVLDLEIIDLEDILPDSPPEKPVDHWIEFILLDGDEQPIENMLCEIELVDGRTRTARTDRFGLIRFDGLTRAGNCTIRVPSEEIADEDEEVETFAAFVLLDEHDQPIADTNCVIVTPDGTRHDATSDASGAVTIDGITETGEYTVEFE